MIHYYLYFALLLLLLEKKEHWFTLFRVSLAAAAVVILYGFGAAAHWNGFVGPYQDPALTTFWERLFSNVRFQGSLGNPAYVAPYLMFAMFYAAWLWLSGRKNLLRNLGYGALLTFFLLIFILSQTRGAFLGLLAAAGVGILYLVYSARGGMRRAALIILLALAMIGGVMFYYRDSPAVANLPGARLLDIDFTEHTAQTRLWTWGTAWRGFKENPLLGWGPENFSAVFDRHFDTRHFVPGENTETWFDRAHSIIFDYLAETGLLGLAAYLSMFAVFLYQFWRRFMRPGEHDRQTLPAGDQFGVHDSALLRALLLMIIAGYFVQGLILFDVLPIFMNLIIVLAFAARLFSERHVHA
jgi:O-antigen ligase